MPAGDRQVNENRESKRVSRLALLIGNDAYEDPRLDQLTAPAADVHALR